MNRLAASVCMAVIAFASTNGESMAQSENYDASVGHIYHNNEASLTTLFVGVFDGTKYKGGASLVVDHSAGTETPTVRFLPQKARWANRPGIVSDKSRVYFTREKPGSRDDSCEVVKLDGDLSNEEIIFSAKTGCSVIGSVTIKGTDYVLANQQHPKKRRVFGLGDSKRNVSIMVLKVPDDGPVEVICNSDGNYTNSTGFLVVPGRGFIKAVNPADEGVVPDPSLFLAFKPSDLSNNTYSVFQDELDAIAYVLGDADIAPARQLLAEQTQSTPVSPYVEGQIVSDSNDTETSFVVVRGGFAERNFKIGYDLRGTAIALPFRSPISEPIPFGVHRFSGDLPFDYERRGTLDLSTIENFISR